MAFVKGVTGNPQGRPKGAQNKTNKQLRETIGDFLNKNFSKLVEDFEELPPKDRVKLYCDLLQYGLPKLQAVQLETDFDRLPEDQLDYLLTKLSNSEFQ